MNNKRKLFVSESGYTLAGVLLIFLIVSVLGMSIVALSLNAMKISMKEHDNQSTYYIAESGANYKIAELEILAKEVTDDIEDLVDTGHFPTLGETGLIDEKAVADEFFTRLNGALSSLTDSYTNFTLIKGHSPKAEPITVDMLPETEDMKREYLILSTGHIGDEKRTVTIPVEIQWHGKPKYALLTKHEINVGSGCGASECGGITIDGDIGVVEPLGENAITFESSINTPLTGSIYVHPNNGVSNELHDYVDESNFTFSDIEGIPQGTEVPNLPVFPDIPSTYAGHDDEEIDGFDVILNKELHITHAKADDYVLNMNENYYFDKILVNGSRTLKIDTNDQDVDLVVGSLEFEQGKIEVLGTGVLTLYIVDEFKLPSAGEVKFNTAGNVELLNIYFKGTGTPAENAITFAGDHIINGSFYAENANLSFGAGAGFKGNILTGGEKVTFVGGSTGSSQIILAPHAEVDLRDGLLKGVVVAESFKSASGTGYLAYSEIDYGNGPLSLNSIINDPVNAGNTFLKRLIPVPERGKQTEILNP